MYATKAYRTANKLQHLLVSRANDPECSASALAQVTRAWNELEDRKRILKMQPKPKDLDTTLCLKATTRSAPMLHASFVDVPEPSQLPDTPQPVVNSVPNEPNA